jgi:quinol-cytochrome oxidoreductase complex cytochrome b subunit/coenzyme F420-reducing hydrogenase delta subunit
MIGRGLKRGFLGLEALLDRVFGSRWNPLYQLGALGFFYYWIVAVSGIYLYIFFDTGTTEAYDSVESLTREQWYLGGVMRSLHRYASDGMVLMMLVHMLREFAYGRFRGPRWFTWSTGFPVLVFVFIAGISGYWLVWDMLAQYIAVATGEWLDWLGIFGEPIARNFLTPLSLDDRFFTLLMFVHIVVPLLLLLVLWIHLLRVSRPQINPNRGLALGTFVMLLALSLVQPAVSHAPANLASIPQRLDLDWYYLSAFPLMDLLSYGGVWALAATVTCVLVLLPWLPPRFRAKPAEVHLAACNGCARCVSDCPYEAILMRPRSDGLPFDFEAVVDPSLCVACGICAGACPTATPFRRKSDLIAGIELPDGLSMSGLRARVEAACRRDGDRPVIAIFGCDHAIAAACLRERGYAVVTQPCIAGFPPSFMDFALSRGLADGVVVTGCRAGNCIERFGVDWTEARIAGRRDPYLRKRVPRDRLLLHWAAPGDEAELILAIDAFAAGLATRPDTSPPPPLPEVRAGQTEREQSHA